MMYGNPYFQPPQGGFYPAQPQGGAMPDNLAAYKAPYQMQQPPMMQQPPQPQQMPQAVSALTFVLGEAEASAYPVALAINGEPLASSISIATPAAVEEFHNVFAAVFVEVPRGCCLTVAVENTSTQAITIENANLIVERVA